MLPWAVYSDNYEKIETYIDALENAGRNKGPPCIVIMLFAAPVAGMALP